VFTQLGIAHVYLDQLAHITHMGMLGANEISRMYGGESRSVAREDKRSQEIRCDRSPAPGKFFSIDSDKQDQSILRE
jgi:hypothetical protein